MVMEFDVTLTLAWLLNMVRGSHRIFDVNLSCIDVKPLSHLSFNVGTGFSRRLFDVGSCVCLPQHLQFVM